MLFLVEVFIVSWVVIGFLSGVYFRFFVERCPMRLIDWIMFVLSGPLFLVMWLMKTFLKLIDEIKI